MHRTTAIHTVGCKPIKEFVPTWRRISLDSYSRQYHLCLVALLCLSGCNAFRGDDTTAIPVTPAAVPTDAPTQTPISRLAPGLNQYGVVDPHALSHAHDAALNNTSYTYLGSITKEYTNGTLRARQTVTIRVGEQNGRFYSIADKDLPRIPGAPTNIRFELWSDGTRVLIARTVGTNTTYQKALVNWVELDHSNSKTLKTLFQAIETRVVDRTRRNGTTLYRIEATNITDPIALFEITNIYPNPETTTIDMNPGNVTFYALIDSHGFVHEYRLNYTKTLATKTNGRNVTIRIVMSGRYTKIGSTTVERPSWYKAANQTQST